MDKVDIDNEDNKDDDESSGDEMLNVEFQPVCQWTSYNGGGGRGKKLVSSRGGGCGSTSIGRGGRGGGFVGNSTAQKNSAPSATANNVAPSNDNNNGINGDGATSNDTADDHVHLAVLWMLLAIHAALGHSNQTVLGQQPYLCCWALHA